MMMRLNVFFTACLLICLKSVTAVPAIVWNKNEASSSSSYISNEISFEQLLLTESSMNNNNNNNNNDITVMFLLERDSKTGDELLTSWTPLLQQTLQQQQQGTNSKQYSHVTGIESNAHVLQKCKDACSEKSTAAVIVEPMIVNFNELEYKLNHTTTTTSNTESEMMMLNVQGGDDAAAAIINPSLLSVPSPIKNKAAVKLSKRQRRIEISNFMIVTVPASIDIDIFDTTLVQTLSHPNVHTIIVSSIRSIHEVKYERYVTMKRQLLDKAIIITDTTTSKTTTTVTDPYHRRLDQQDNNNNNDNNNLSGIYYVQMTPNILSGLLFFGLFTIVTIIGLSCMNMITGQDVYVTTMPSIGREA